MEEDRGYATIPTGLEQPEQPLGNGAVEWTASEFIAHDKTAGWYMLLAVGAILLAAVLYIVTHDWITAGVILVAALFFGIYASHKPRQLPYKIDGHGLSVGNKHYYYHEFRSFSILPEAGFSSITLMPLKRFAAPTTIYYSLEDEENIVGILADHLPLEERKPDAIDSLMRRVRF